MAHFFAGAVGCYKNPHRQHLLKLVSLLLRIVHKRSVAF
jgi:hypothetical protein